MVNIFYKREKKYKKRFFINRIYTYRQKKNLYLSNYITKILIFDFIFE